MSACPTRGGEGCIVYRLYVCSSGRDPQCLHLPGDALLPCVQQLRLTASRFFCRADTEVGWTDLRALTALERFYRMAGIPFRVDRAFCGKCPMGTRGSGVTFDIGSDLSEARRRQLRYRAVESGLFYAVSPEALCPNCVHIDCLGCRDLRAGDRGVFVFSLQQALQWEGFFQGVCSGAFCAQTLRAMLRFQQAHGLPMTGVADAGCRMLLYRRQKNRDRIFL